MIFDSEGEFQGFEFQELLASYGVTPKPITVKNPEAKSIIKMYALPWVACYTQKHLSWMPEICDGTKSIPSY